jgi:hypothetical protein
VTFVRGRARILRATDGLEHGVKEERMNIVPAIILTIVAVLAMVVLTVIKVGRELREASEQSRKQRS